MIPFRPKFSPKSCYLLRDEEEVAYFESRGGAPEAPLIEWAANELIKPDQAFIDVGAHIGTWTQHFAQRCESVIAFEPQIETYQRLMDGLSLTRFQNVECHQYALADVQGWQDLHIVSADGGGSTLRYREQLGPALATRQVRTRLLDTIPLNDVRIGLIKIDAEGMESAIVDGAARTIKAHRPKLLVEAWQHDWYADERAGLKTRLEVIGYRVQPVLNYPEMLLATFD